MTVPGSMGLATALNFQPTGTGKAAITGDFVLLNSEVNAVIKALRQNGIQVTTLHNHMLQEEPHLFFVHFGQMTTRQACEGPASSIGQHKLSEMTKENCNDHY